MLTKEGKIKFSELFYSIQGEGLRAGIPAAWVRFFTCNLNCNGFGQPDATDPSTYVLPYKTVELKGITRLEDLPVFERGCDSSYSWSARFKHLQHEMLPQDLVQELKQKMKTATNPESKFIHPVTQNPIDLIFTGGEPLLPANQQSIVTLLEQLEDDFTAPIYVTFETNGTQQVSDELFKFYFRHHTIHFFFSVSPKLFTMSGELYDKAIAPALINVPKMVLHDGYQEGQLKFVVNADDRVWEELDKTVAAFRDAGVKWPVMVMPVGGTLEGITSVQTQVANRALERGYYFTTRLQNILWGNGMGV